MYRGVPEMYHCRTEEWLNHAVCTPRYGWYTVFQVIVKYIRDVSAVSSDVFREWLDSAV